MRTRTRVRKALRTVRQHAAIPVLALLAGAAGAYAVTISVPPTYEAVASVMVVPAKAADGGAPNGVDISVAQNLAPTIARLAESRQVATDAAAALGLAEELVVGRVSGASEPGLQIVTIRATARTGAQAAAITNAVTEALSREVGAMRIGGDSPVTAEPFDRAAPPLTPETPKPQLNLLLGGFAGLLAGLALASLRNRLDDRLRRLGQTEEYLRLPVVGVLPQLPRRGTARAGETYARPDVAGTVKGAVAALSVLTAPSPRCRVLVVGVHDTTTVDLVAGILALGLAEQLHRATLLEGEIGQPTLAEVFPGSERCTVQQVIAGERRPEPLAGCGSLSVVPADPIRRTFGAAPPRAERIGTLLDELAEGGGAVVATAPPVLTGADLPALARHADAVLLVVHANRTRKSAAKRATLLLQRLDVPLVGVLLVGGADESDNPVSSAWPAVRAARPVPHHDPAPDPAGTPTRRPRPARTPLAPVPAPAGRTASVARPAAPAGGPAPGTTRPVVPAGGRDPAVTGPDRVAPVPVGTAIGPDGVAPVPVGAPAGSGRVAPVPVGASAGPDDHMPDQGWPEPSSAFDADLPILARFRAAMQRQPSSAVLPWVGSPGPTVPHTSRRPNRDLEKP
ncbi:hypothetical protein [Plantactinospora endophytica]|uniref:Polysaccharide chain length determinant N-terminal domain-containing protein n=1 Tax=Plantactinospora endophytica TaxID=673535 RepID=A0ABQ4E1B7_9ACTN|nr:hypothetical protein [Plantactinospora endophytica]GIG88510.1 hypothetical protein Pen02_34460 [Plantactinospora endophytica]